jgi:predicted site-specific integrase-resolvase
MPTTDSSSSERAWVKPRELADREGVHRATIWRWVEKGLAEARRLGPRTGVRVRAVDAKGKD